MGARAHGFVRCGIDPGLLAGEPKETARARWDGPTLERHWSSRRFCQHRVGGVGLAGLLWVFCIDDRFLFVMVDPML